MQRKFKHKKTQDVVITSKTSPGYYKNVHTSSLVPGKYVENSNDWEEICSKCGQELPKKEKDWEILAYRSKLTHAIYERISENKFEETRTRVQVRLVDFYRDTSEIYSVRRLDDGKIFTIGDNTNFEKIEEILIDKINPNILIFKFLKNDTTHSCYINCLNTLIHKPIIFKTEDNVECFGGETIYGILLQNLNSDWHTVKNIDEIDVKMLHGGRKWFFDKEKAQEYYFENVPCLSFQDVKNVIYWGFYPIDRIVFAENLVENKLKCKIMK